MASECECPEEHSITKLGHCRDCPWYKSGQLVMTDPSLLSRTGCPPRHADGSAHDFDWATYADERESTGVCRCGVTFASETLWW